MSGELQALRGEIADLRREIAETRERVVAVEKAQEHTDEAITSMRRKVDSIYDVLMQARGAKWAVWTLALTVSAVLGYAMRYLFPGR